MDKVVNTIRAVIGLALLVLVLIFCFQNMDAVDIQFLSLKVDGLPLFIALFGVLAFGGFIGFLFGLISGSKKKREEAKKAKRVERTTRHTDTLEARDKADNDATNSLTE